MKKRLKWLLVGSLMCLGLGSVFHQGYGMMNNEEIIEDIEFDNSYEDKECSWKQKAVKVGASEVELEKVEKGFFSYKDIIIGYKYWNKFEKIKDLNDVTNEEKLELLMQSAANGNENAIDHLLKAYRDGDHGLQRNDPEGLVFAKKYADKGSKKAIKMLLIVCYCGWYGIEEHDPKGLELAEEYADKGSEEAVWYLLRAYFYGWYGLQRNNAKCLELAEEYADKSSKVAIDYLLFAYEHGDHGLQKHDPKGLELAQKYTEEGSEVAIDYFLNAYERDLYGDQKYDSEIFKLVTTLVIDGNSLALRIFNQHKDKVKSNFKRNDKQMPFSDVSFSFN